MDKILMWSLVIFSQWRDTFEEMKKTWKSILFKNVYEYINWKGYAWEKMIEKF